MAHDEFSAADLLGSVVDDRFEILEKLGEGGMGAIYKARQISMDRVVALKILLHDQRGDPISVERFRHEAYLASRLRHPNAIVIHDFGQTPDGLLYIAMEFLAGETLKERLARVGPLDVPVAVKVMTQALRTIAEAHRMNLVHRDLKPDNIFLTSLEGDTDFVKVLDFGIAKLTAVRDGAEGYQGGLTAQGKIYGTPNYMSPEQIRGKPVDQQSDLYSLGVIFYEVLTGQVPFTAQTPVDVMMMHLRETPAPLTDLRADVPLELERTVLRALEKDRRVRYQSGDEFLEAIENFKFNSGFYAVLARLAAMSMKEPPEEPVIDDEDDDDDELGETLMLADGAQPAINPFAPQA
ncbi:MAG: serine/threonine protein kinase, partial [Myxococcales bacterium]|nr:serine/threonine protein kinase [Myxococcales bacterium]